MRARAAGGVVILAAALLVGAQPRAGAAGEKCLDVTGNNPADATPLQLWSCHGGANQKWTLP